MKALFCCFTTVAFLLATPGTTAAQEALSLMRQDQQRVPATAYAPRTPTCQGIAMISPGAGGSEDGYRYLGEVMASLGYLAVVMGHPESGRRALQEHVVRSGIRDGLAALITEQAAYRGRFMDIAASRKWAQSRCDSSESLLVGHSMGAATAMMEAGAHNKLGIRGTNAFSAYIALSPQGAGIIFPDDAWADIRQPVLLLTGTRDDELGGASWQTRTDAFRSMPAGCKWLGVMEGATHMNFAGRGMSRLTETRTAQTIASFLDALHGGGCRLVRPIPGVEIDTK